MVRMNADASKTPRGVLLVRRHVVDAAGARDLRGLASAIFVHEPSGRPMALYEPEETVLRAPEGRPAPGEPDADLCLRCDHLLGAVLAQMGCTTAEEMVNLGEAVKVCAPAGEVLGYLSPVQPSQPIDQARRLALLAAEQLERRRRELRERPLGEILTELEGESPQ